MSKIERFATGFALLGVLAIGIVNAVTISEQQTAVELMVTALAENVEYDVKYERRVWDLHQRVMQLEGRTVALSSEDERLMAHIRWFVMRRSGTDELRRMEAAVVRLEREEAIAGD